MLHGIITNGTNGNHTEFATMDTETLREIVGEVVNNTQVTDIHTHLFAPEFGKMNLYGIDELLTYHYLVAELFRFCDIKPEEFFNLNKSEKAEFVWKYLFVENSPLSEAAIGVITVLNELGLDANTHDLNEIRAYFNAVELSEHTNRILQKAKVKKVVMTNDPFDAEEVEIWEKTAQMNEHFSAALRLDRLLNNWHNTATKQNWSNDLNKNTISEIRQFFDVWIEKMSPLYLAVSLPDSFDYFALDNRNKLIREVVLPTAREHNLPFALMLGVRRNVNPTLRAAGDGVGLCDNKSLENLCLENPEVNFLATYLSRENQHELCVSARKFSNLMPFGCWWFLNNPSIVLEITKERLELLGTSFIPQHSDARVLEQLIYKWKHSRKIIADVLTESYDRLINAGRNITKREIERDVEKLFSGNFQNWTKSVKTEPTI
ncbi:MAG TPA: hypothetical protein PKY59_24805 [Pyrinomonadaceae bacterium]|nr:hypothetical protein [Pyrinomonadaceae bacterium]